MNDERLIYLFNGFLQETATPEETAELEEWYADRQRSPGLLDALNEVQTDAFKRTMLATIHERIGSEPAKRDLKVRSLRQPALRSLRWISVAASVMAAALTLLMLSQRHPSPASSQQANESLVVVANTGTGIKNFLLEDGSGIGLAPGSSIRYKRPFAGSRRELYLQGEAMFTVTKDQQHPFTVFGGQLATTALGTKFTVIARVEDSVEQVQLHQGSVVVKAISPAKTPFADVYLAAGQRLVFNRRTDLVIVNATSPAGKNDLAGNSSIGSRTGISISFESTPLTKVLKELAAHYNVTLQYRPEELQEMDFTGTIQKKDSLAKVLHTIALLNNLTITPQPSGYRIRKTK